MDKRGHISAVAAMAIMAVAIVICAVMLVLPPLVPALQKPAYRETGVAIDASNFPDAAFRSYVSSHFDTNANGALSQKECDAVTAIGTYDEDAFAITDAGVSNSLVKSLQGVEYFPNLMSLEARGNSITSLDVSENYSLRYLDMRGNPDFSLSYDGGGISTQVLVDPDCTNLEDASGLVVVHAT